MFPFPFWFIWSLGYLEDICFKLSLKLTLNFINTNTMPILRASLMTQVIKGPPTVQETQEMRFQALGWEDPLKEEMATYSSILAWRIPWTEEPGGLLSMRSQIVRHTWPCTHTYTYFRQQMLELNKYCIGHTYGKTLFVVFSNFKLNWGSC